MIMKMDDNHDECNGQRTATQSDNIENGHSSNNELLTLLTQLTEFDDIERFFLTLSGEEEGVELPKSLIITNLDINIFRDASSSERRQFEAAFREFDCDATFYYFKSFRRARVDYNSSLAATKARICCHQKTIGQERINCYFADLQSNDISADKTHLRPPAAEKQFLISPPASPPEGWHPVEESEPVLNIDLQSALANLLPGSKHELHPPSEHQPGIVVHIAAQCPTVEFSGPKEQKEEFSNYIHEAEDSDFDDVRPCQPMSMTMNRNIPQTACPPR